MANLIETCSQCGHAWRPRRPNPRRCPVCKSIRWNQPENTKFVCSACGAAYDSRVAASSHQRRLGDDQHGPTGVVRKGLTIIEIVVGDKDGKA